VLVSKKISAKFRPNFAKFGNFGGGRNFCDNEIKNLDPNNNVPQAKCKFARDSKKDDADQGQYNRNIMKLTLSRLQV